VLDVARDGLAPLPLLAALKHPLAAGGVAPEAFRALVRRLEIAALRGPRPAPGIARLRATLTTGPPELGIFLDPLQPALGALLAPLAERETPVRALVAAHIAAAEALAASAEESGAARLWREPAGEAAAEFLAELLQAVDTLPPLDGAGYQALF